jgi:hypothetical protein
LNLPQPTFAVKTLVFFSCLALPYLALPYLALPCLPPFQKEKKEKKRKKTKKTKKNQKKTEGHQIENKKILPPTKF